MYDTLVPYVPYKGESWEHKRVPEDALYERAWIIGYAITYRHDPRPLELASAGFNRVEICRDAPEIPRMARYFWLVDAAMEASKHLPPWKRMRAIALAEAKGMGYDRARTKKMLRDLAATERAELAAGIVRKRPVTSDTLMKWYRRAKL